MAMPEIKCSQWFGEHITCPLCSRPAPVPNGLTEVHVKGNGVRCGYEGVAVTLEGAIARDSRLNPSEERVKWVVFRDSIRCRGFIPETGEPCHHPACKKKVLRYV